MLKMTPWHRMCGADWSQRASAREVCSSTALSLGPVGVLVSIVCGSILYPKLRPAAVYGCKRGGAAAHTTRCAKRIRPGAPRMLPNGPALRRRRPYAPQSPGGQRLRQRPGAALWRTVGGRCLCPMTPKRLVACRQPCAWAEKSGGRRLVWRGFLAFVLAAWR